MLKENDEYNFPLMRLTLIDLITAITFDEILMFLFLDFFKAYKIKNN